MPPASRPALVPLEGGDSIESLFKLAEPLVKSGFLPDYIKTPGQAVAIIMAGREMGVQPMQSLRSINLVKGKITINADLQLALFVRDGGRFKWLKDDINGAELWLRHPSGNEYTASFSQADAKTAGLWGKAGTPWQLHPRPMMRARTITGGMKAVGYEPVSGAYDDVSGELPGAPVPAYEPVVRVGIDPVVETGEVVDPETGEVVQEAVTGYTRVTDVAVARAMRLPFPNAPDQPLDELSSNHLRRIYQWVAGKREEKGDEDFMVGLTDGIGLVLADREANDERGGAGDAAAPASTFTGDEYPVADLGSTLPATKPGSNLPPPGTAANPPATSRIGRIKRINELLTHPACAQLSAETRHNLTNNPKDRDLTVMIATLESMIAAPSDAGATTEGELGPGVARKPSPSAQSQGH
jgi:hypothetical protein